MGIGETLRRALAKLVMRAARDQAKTAYGNLQLCADLGADIKGSTHAVGQNRIERVRRRQQAEEEAENSEEEEERGGVTVLLNILTKKTGGTEEEATEHLKVALGMEVEEDNGSKGEEGGDVNQKALVA